MTAATIYRRLRSPESLLLGSMFFASGLNFLFSMLVGRTVNFEVLSIFSLVNTFLYICNIVLGAYAGTINHQVSYISSKYGIEEAQRFYSSQITKLRFITVIGTLGWLISSPLLAMYFHTTDPLIYITFAPALVLGTYGALSRGCATGRFHFQVTAAIYLSEPITKIAVLMILWLTGTMHYLYIAVPFSLIVPAIVGMRAYIFTYKKVKNTKERVFQRKFFTAALLNNIATNTFLTLDVILVTHYLSRHESGVYGLLSIVGKMIFFFGTVFHIFIFSFVSRDVGKGQNPNRNFYFLLAATSALCTLIYIPIGPLGTFFLPLVFNEKAYAILPYSLWYGGAIVLFTIANTLSVYHLARRHYSFIALSILTTVAMIVGITFHHATMADVVYQVSVMSVAYFLLGVSFHFLMRDGGFLIANVVDLISLFHPLAEGKAKKDGLRILIFNWRDVRHKYAGGAEVYIHECAKRWVNMGHAVTVFCGNDGDSPRFEVRDGVYVIRRGGFYMVYIWAFLYYALRLKGKFDIILDCENGIPFFTPLFAKEKVALLIHHVHQDVFRRTLWFPFSWIASYLELKVMPELYKHVPFVTVSPSTKAEIMLHKMTEVEPHIVYGGIDTSHFVAGEKTHTPTILYLGRLKKYKSVHVILRAMKLVLEQIPDARLVIAGDGEEMGQLKALTKSLGLNSEVTFTGKIKDDEKVRLYQSAHVFVQPSYIEGWGITIIEANACGVPVVASNVTGLRDSVRNGITGILVEYGDVKCFAEAICTLLTDKKKADVMSEEARKWASQFDWDKSATQAIDIMHSLITP